LGLNPQNKQSAASESRVLKALLQKSPQTWSELLEVTKLSSRTLRKALLRLERQGKVFRRVDTGEKYPPPVLYGLTDVGRQSLAPLVFASEARQWWLGFQLQWERAEFFKYTTADSLGMKIPAKGIFENLDAGARLQAMARRFFAAKLFMLIKALETNDSAWSEMVPEDLFDPYLLLQLGVPLEPLRRTEEGKVVAEAAAKVKTHSPLIFEETWKKLKLPDSALAYLKAVFKAAFPKEFEELQKLYDECSKRVS
jgi:DNA-binding HxlR family transcriptional regulator